ncbi:MAG: hypothetical protein D6818_04645 [Bacteroidetes bacterium]|nr:MAG: hypothetical protein D6818_04645 [Bacteroidota bacterium]
MPFGAEDDVAAVFDKDVFNARIFGTACLFLLQMLDSSCRPLSSGVAGNWVDRGLDEFFIPWHATCIGIEPERATES